MRVLRFVCVVKCISSSLIFVPEQYSIVRIYGNLIFFFQFSWYLGHFQFGALWIWLLWTFLVQVSFCEPEFSFFLNIGLRVELFRSLPVFQRPRTILNSCQYGVSVPVATRVRPSNGPQRHPGSNPQNQWILRNMAKGTC